MSQPNEKEMVNHPNHYQSAGGVECIDVMLALFGPKAVSTFCVLNAFKYLWRCDKKNNKVQDLKKAKWYIEKALSLL